MKKTALLLIPLLGIVFMAACQSLEKPQSTNPVITTLAPDVYADYVIFYAEANADVDFSEDTQTYFEYKEKSGYYTQRITIPDQFKGSYTASARVTGLKDGTDYSYRYCASCGNVTITGNYVSFKTIERYPTATIKSVTCTEKKYYPKGITYKDNTYYYTFKFDIKAVFTGIPQIEEAGIDFNSSLSLGKLNSSEVNQSWTWYTTNKSFSAEIRAMAKLLSGKYIYSNPYEMTYTYGSSSKSSAEKEAVCVGVRED